MADRAQGRRPENRPGGGRLGPRAGIPKRTRPKLPPNGILSNQRGLHQCEKGRGPKDPTVRRAGTREPRRRGATLLLRVVAATAGAQWTDGWGRSTYVLAVVIQFIDNVLNFPAVLRRHGTHRPTFQKIDEFRSFDVVASFLCDSWHSLARGHGLCLPLPRGKTLEIFFAERVRRVPGESHGHSVFTFFLRARFARKNVLFSEFLVSHTTSRRRLPQTLSYSSAHSSASPSPVGTSFLRRREQIAWFTATCPVLFRRSTSSHRCSSWTSW